MRELFAALQEVVEADAKVASEKLDRDFAFRVKAVDAFVVTRRERGTGITLDARSFTLDADAHLIFVERPPSDGDDNVLLVGRAALVDGAPGDNLLCLIDTEERHRGRMTKSGPLQLWQFSRLALEPLFFRGR